MYTSRQEVIFDLYIYLGSWFIKMEKFNDYKN